MTNISRADCDALLKRIAYSIPDNFSDADLAFNVEISATIRALRDALDAKEAKCGAMRTAIFAFTDQLRDGGVQLTRNQYGLLIEMKKCALSASPKETP